MTTITKIIIEAAYICANISLGKIEAHMFDVDQKIINHKHWAIGVFIVSSFPLLGLLDNGWQWVYLWLWLAACAIHFPVFSVSLNKSRIPPRAWDYRNIADPKGSTWDKWLGKWYAEVFFGSIAIWIALQFLIF
jgi:hypothetical protein